MYRGLRRVSALLLNGEEHNVNVVVLVPFNEGHMVRIREAAGPDATVTQIIPKGPVAAQTAVREAVEQADVVIGEPALSHLKGAKSLKWVQMTWAGTDQYTSGTLFPEGIALTNVAGYAYGHTVSQYVVGQILSMTQNLGAYIRQQPTESWKDLGPVKSLEGSTVLVYGAGDIGSCVAKRLSGFDVERIIGVCRDATAPRPYFDELVTLPQAESRLVDADVVVCCLPKSPETTNYFNDRRFSRMKEGAVLVNVGRGSFVDMNALYRALGSGRLRGAALDVTEPEPLPLKHPLWRHPRCNITPHISGGAFGHSVETEERICEICCDNLRRYVAGEPLTHQVI